MDRSRPALTVKTHIGLVLAVLLGVSDLSSLTGLGTASQPGYIGPPVDVLVFDSVLGLVTVVAAAAAWAGLHRRASLRLAALARLVSIVTALPAFFVGGVPAWLVAVAALGVVVTVLDLWLLLSRPRARAQSAALV